MKLLAMVFRIALPALVASIGSGAGAALLVRVGDLTYSGGWIFFYLVTPLGLANSGYVAVTYFRRR